MDTRSNVHRFKAVWGSRALGLGLLASTVLSVSCGKVAGQGTGGSYLVINRLEAAPGTDPTEFQGTLNSDVITIVEEQPTLVNDMGRVTFSVGMKNPGPASAPNAPSQYDFITVDRYRVRFTRADGRNTPGVDVPYGFDGAFTVTVGGGEQSVVFEMVRHVMKMEAPLAALAHNARIISTIAELTFYGRDLAGREVTASGRLLIDFGNFADPD